jgi:hypothetical protein
MTSKEIHEFLSQIMRGIDKKTVLTIEPAPSTNDREAVLVRLVRDRRVASLQVRAADVTAAQGDIIQRERLRVALKRAADRMWEVTGYFFETKLERPKASNSFSDWQSHNRGRR